MVYYIMYQGQVTGPMSKEQMMAYGVNRDTMVSADGGEWRALYTYPELMEILATASPASVGAGVQRQMGFFEAIKTVLGKYADFSGRAQRSEFWWWNLGYAIVYYAIYFVIGGVYGGDLSRFMETQDFAYYPTGMVVWLGLFNLAFLLPNLAVSVRRLHDTGRSGWWFLLNFLCCVGGIVLLVWYCQGSEEGENEYGPEPNVE